VCACAFVRASAQLPPCPPCESQAVSLNWLEKKETLQQFQSTPMSPLPSIGEFNERWCENLPAAPNLSISNLLYCSPWRLCDVQQLHAIMMQLVHLEQRRKFDRKITRKIGSFPDNKFELVRFLWFESCGLNPQISWQSWVLADEMCLRHGSIKTYPRSKV